MPSNNIKLQSKPRAGALPTSYRQINALSQQGVALLTILLLVVSITVVAGAMLASQKITIRQSGLLFEQDQLLQDIKAGQALAVALIKADSKINNHDSLQDAWAQPIPPHQQGINTVTVQITDEASRFNINNLYHDGAVDTAALEVFKRLLIQVGADENIATAVLDWQDPDDTVYNDSANEAAIYQNGAQHPIMNQPFLSIEQLGEVSGVDIDVLTKLRPYLTAVPYFLPVNINTAKPEVLAALVDGADPEQMQAVTSMTATTPLESSDGIWQVAPFSTLEEDARNAITPLVAVESRAFAALITAQSANAADKKNGNQGQRYASVLISKVNTAQQGQGEQGMGSTRTDTDKSNTPKDVQAFLQRLWAYPPIQ